MRSLLFVPGDQPDKIEKARRSGADVLILDLEDSVAAERKAGAREIVAAALGAPDRDGPTLIVRVNPLDGPHCDADVDAVVPARPAAIMLPKARGGGDVMHLSAKLAAAEAMADLPEGSIGILPIATETPAAIFGLGSYAGASRRLVGLTWGAEDLSAEVGSETTREADGRPTSPYRLARDLSLFAAISAGVEPIDTVFPPFRDLDGLEREAVRARRDGFTGKMAIHPAQVPVINAVFTPAAADLDRARRIVAAFRGRSHARRDRHRRADGRPTSSPEGAAPDRARVRHGS